MAIIKISELPSATTPLSYTEVTPIVQNDVTKQVSLNDVLTYKYPNASTVNRTVFDRLEDEVSILDFIPTQYHDAIRNNTLTADVSVFVQAAIDAGKPLFWPAGTYIVNNVNNDNAPSKVVVWRGASSTKTILKTTARQNYVLRIGTPGAPWGSGGRLELSEMRFVYGLPGWDTLTGNPNIGLLTMYRASSSRIIQLACSESNNCGIYINDIGYTSITECNIGGHRYDCINFDSTDLNNPVTSTLVESSQVNTGLRSSVRIKDGFNISIRQCQMEDSETAVLIEGTDNRMLVINENYVEATRGDYDIDAGSCAGIGFSIYDNYLFGTPDVATLNLPSNPQSNFQPLIYYNNFGATPKIAVNGVVVDAGATTNNQQLQNFCNLEWLQNSRSISGGAVLTGAYAWASGQQTSQVEARTANGFGAGIKGTSVGGIAYFGLLRGPAFDNTAPNDRAYLALEYTNKGAINIAPSESYALHIYGGATVGRVQNALKCSYEGGDIMWTGGLGNAMDGTPNAADAALLLKKVNTTSRSINAAGTVNASGTDYAEYMTKAGDFAFAKGDVCGINANGLLTDTFVDAVAFVVKSTNPSYVGGDTWGDCADIGNAPERPSREILKDDAGNAVTDSEGNGVLESEDAFNARFAEYQAKYAEWDIKFQAKRAKVDRIAFSGQVPVNVYGAKPGDYIVPADDSGKIKGVAVANPSFEQYQLAVGKVIAIEPDGRAKIIVKVA